MANWQEQRRLRIYLNEVKALNESNKPIVEMRHIVKSYPGVLALDDVSFTLYPGQVHSICGENGAGKSTLIKVLTGAEIRDSGTVKLDNVEIDPQTPMDAQNLGISTVYQEVNLCPNLTVAENIFIGRQPTKAGVVDWKEMSLLADYAMARLNIRLNVNDRLDEYSVAIQQMVAIARAVDTQAKVLVLDEPTSSLDQTEVRQLFSVVKRLRTNGMGIVFISHFLEQVFEISDQITILRNGKLVDSKPIDQITNMELISKMIGKDYEKLKIDSARTEEKTSKKGNPFYSARNLGKKGVIAPADVEVNKGEVLGLAGLLGCGRTETAQLIFGIVKPDKAEISIDGKPAKIHAPSDAIQYGMGFTPEDRKTDGIIGNLTVRENIILALQGKMGLFKRLSRKRQQEIADKYIELLSIATPGSEQLVRNLSGGNQQKVILARWLATDPDLLILDEPTRGIDVGAKEEIMNLVSDLADDEDKSIVFISSEIDELIRVSHRAYVYRDRAQIGEIDCIDLTPQHVMELLAGGESSDESQNSSTEEANYG
jgi:monosaccharide-transporting ATPase